MSAPSPVDAIPSVHLVDQFRDMVMAFTRDPSRKDLLLKIEQYQAEIIRRMAWG